MRPIWGKTEREYINKKSVVEKNVSSWFWFAISLMSLGFAIAFAIKVIS